MYGHHLGPKSKVKKKIFKLNFSNDFFKKIFQALLKSSRVHIIWQNEVFMEFNLGYHEKFEKIGFFGEGLGYMCG